MAAATWFRAPKYLERVDYVRFDLQNPLKMPPNGAFQIKDGLKFFSTNRDVIYDWYNAYFSVNYRFEAKADGANVANDKQTAPINGSFSLLKKVTISSGGKQLYQANNVHKVIFIKTLLEDSSDYATSVARDEFWYLDAAEDTALNGDNKALIERQKLARGAGTVKTIIPLKRFSFFEALWDRLLPPMNLEFTLELQQDNEMIYQNNNTDLRRIVVKELELWAPKLTFVAEGQKMLNERFLKLSVWTYLQESQCWKVRLLLLTRKGLLPSGG